MQLEKHVHHQHHKQTKSQTDKKGISLPVAFSDTESSNSESWHSFLYRVQYAQMVIVGKTRFGIYGFTICFWFLLRARNINRNHGLWKVAHRCRMKRYNGHPDVQVSAYQPNMLIYIYIFFGSKSMCRFCTLRNLMRYQCLTTCLNFTLRRQS